MFLAIAPGAVSEMHAVASMRKTIPMNAQVTGSWFRVAICPSFSWISPWNDRPMSLKCSLFSAVLVCPITYWYIYTIHIWHTLYMFSIQICTCVYHPWPFHCITFVKLWSNTHIYGHLALQVSPLQWRTVTPASALWRTMRWNTQSKCLCRTFEAAVAFVFYWILMWNIQIFNNQHS